MDCERAREAMFRMSDNELEPDLVVPFRKHLGDCPTCAQHFDYVGKLLALIRGRCCRYQAPDSLRFRILATFTHRSGSLQETAE